MDSIRNKYTEDAEDGFQRSNPYKFSFANGISKTTTTQRISRVLAKGDRASRAFGLRNSIYVGSTVDLLWTPGEEIFTSEKQDAQQPEPDRLPLQESRPSLHPADKGRRAYLFLLCAFLIEAVMWGIPLTSAGVFASFYTQQPGFKHNRFIAVIGALGTGIPFLGAPFITPLTSRWHKHQPFMIWLGWLICTFALLAASFSTTVTELILTQGLMYGIGLLILYYALLSMLNEWFDERRGLAYGILFAAGGLSGTGLPFLAEFLLRKFDYAWTLRGFAIALVVLIGPLLPFCRGRLKPQNDVKANAVNFKQVLFNPLFYFFSVSNIFQGLAFYLPSLYVGVYANALGFTSQKGVIIICLLNLSQVVSQVAIGWLSDFANIFVLLLMSSIGSAVFGCALWYVANGFSHLVAFAVTYGLFAGGYNVLYTRFCSACADDAPTTLWLFGILSFERGIGNIVAGPISAALLHQIRRHQQDSKQQSISTSTSAHAYRQLAIFVGACMLASSVGALGYVWRGYASAPGRFAACKLIRRSTYWRRGRRPVITIQRPASVVHYREDHVHGDGRPF